EVVITGGEQRLVDARQPGRVPQRGHDRVGHRDRAQVTGLGLTPDVQAGRAGHVRAGAAVRPGGRVQPAAHRDAQQVVPGGVELHLVHAVAVPVVGAELRRVLV